MTRLLISIAAFIALVAAALYLSTESWAWSDYDDDLDARITEQELGDFTHSSGEIDGRRFRSTKQRIGDFEYERGSIGDGRTFRCTSQRIGDFVYRDCN